MVIYKITTNSGMKFFAIENDNLVSHDLREPQKWCQQMGGIEKVMEKAEKTAFSSLEEAMRDRNKILREKAEKMANEVGVYEVNAELLPDDKLKKAEELKKEGVLIYVGDGINDAPVMMTADCAVSMGKLGSAAAVEASDLVLISDDLSAIPTALRIARKTRAVVLQNIVFSIAMKVAFMALGALGILPLWLAVFADVGVMLLAVANSFRVRFIKTKKK